MEPVESGAYVAVSVSEPTARDPARIVIVAEPAVRGVADELYPPPVSVTVPVAAGLPVPVFTATVTLNDWVTEMLEAAGVTETAGVALLTVTLEDEPVAPLKDAEPDASGT